MNNVDFEESERMKEPQKVLSRFNLGDRVVVSGTIKPFYRSFLKTNYKLWIKKKVTSPIIGIVVRRSTKRGGIQHKGFIGFNSFFGEDEGYNAYLEVKRTYRTYDISYDINRKTITCALPQLERIE